MTDTKQQAVTTLTENKTEQNVQSMTSVIEVAIANPEVDVEKINALITANERVLDRQAEIDYNKSMAALRRELAQVTIVKNKQNGQTSSRYADLEAIKKAVDPLLAKHGFFERYENDYPEKDLIGTTCEIVHESGHSKRNRVQIHFDNAGIKGSINKTKPHAAASSMTYGERLALCKALGIKTSDDDDGNQFIDYELDDDQLASLQSLIDETDADIAQFCEFMGVAAIKQIKQKNYLKAANMLRAKKKRIEDQRARMAAEAETAKAKVENSQQEASDDETAKEGELI